MNEKALWNDVMEIAFAGQSGIDEGGGVRALTKVLTKHELRIYSWPCSIATDGNISVLARSLGEARKLVRAQSNARDLERYILDKPTVERGPRVLNS